MGHPIIQRRGLNSTMWLLTLSVTLSSLHSIFSIGEGLFGPTSTAFLTHRADTPRLLYGPTTTRQTSDRILIQRLQFHSVKNLW